MSPLEKLAKTLFEEFSQRELGRLANWTYLSKGRKIAWMNDVLHIHDHIAQKLIDNVKPVGNLSSINNSWGMGYNEGVRAERINFINLVESLHQDLVDDLITFNERKN